MWALSGRLAWQAAHRAAEEAEQRLAGATVAFLHGEGPPVPQEMREEARTLRIRAAQAHLEHMAAVDRSMRTLAHRQGSIDFALRTVRRFAELESG